MERPQLIRTGIADMQVCVPAAWSDDEVVAFGESHNPCGIRPGWRVRTNPELLAGCPVRNPCVDRENFVHVTLDC